MIVRAAVGSDAEAVARVHVESWRATYKGFVPDDVLAALSAEERAEMWRRLIAEPGSRRGVLVAEEDGVVVGFCHYCPSRDGDDDDTGEITSIYLAADRWRRGRGRELLRAAELAMTDSGYSRAVLWVLDENERARAFYEASAWVHDGAVKIDDRGDFELHLVRYIRALEAS